MNQQYGFMPRLNGLTDDLSHAELLDLMAYMLSHRAATFALIKRWRRDNGKSVDMLKD